MLVISDDQRKALRESALQTFIANMREHVKSFAPELCAAAGEAGVAAFVDDGVARAMALGQRQRGPVRLWLELGCTLGHRFDIDPQHRPIWPDDDPETLPMPFAQHLHENSAAYVTACLGGDRAILLRAIRGVLARSLKPVGEVEGHVLATLQLVWPERLDFAGEAPLRALIETTAQSAEKADLRSPEGRTLCAALGVCFGAGFLDDPLYPWLAARLIGPESDPAPEAVRIDETMKALRFYAEEAARFLAASGGAQ